MTHGASDESGTTARRVRPAAVAGLALVVVVAGVAIVMASQAGDDDPGAGASDVPAEDPTDPQGSDDVDGEAAREPDDAAETGGGDEPRDTSPPEGSDEDEDVAGDRTGLREAAPDDLRIGSAVAGGGHHVQQAYPDPFASDEAYREVLAREFDSVTPENQLKWEFVRPQRDDFRLGPAEDIVAFAREHDQQVRGHTLLWHSQNPSWLENGDFTDDELRALLRDHIETVVTHFRGDIAQWDVANEIFDDAAQLRTEENLWLRELGIEIVADAFRWAHAADPDALLFLNDYNVDGINAKSTAYHELVRELLDDDVPVHGFGIQGHLSIDYDFPQGVEDNLRRFDELGLETAVTELDVRMSLPEGGPTQEQLERQAEDYARMVDACLRVEGCRSFTLWGVTDRYSWVPHFFSGEGAATVLDDDLQPRPAYHELRDRLEAGRAS